MGPFGSVAVCEGPKGAQRETPGIGSYVGNVAEGEGFEPPVGLTLRRFSKPVPSTTRPSLRAAERAHRSPAGEEGRYFEESEAPPLLGRRATTKRPISRTPKPSNSQRVVSRLLRPLKDPRGQG